MKQLRAESSKIKIRLASAEKEADDAGSAAKENAKLLAEAKKQAQAAEAAATEAKERLVAAEQQAKKAAGDLEGAKKDATALVKKEPAKGISIAELPPPPALPEMAKDIGWSKFNKDQLDKVLSAYDKDQVSAFLEFDATTMRTNENAPTAVQHAWLKRALEKSRPRAVAVLERDLALAIAQDDLRGAILVIIAANKVDKDNPLRGQKALIKLKEQLHGVAAVPQPVWKLTRAKASWYGGSYSEKDFVNNQFTVSPNPGFKLLRVSASVENISSKSDPPYASRAIGGLEGEIVDFGRERAVTNKPRRIASDLSVKLLHKKGTKVEVLYPRVVMETSPALRGKTVTLSPIATMICSGTYVEQGESFHLDVLFEVPLNTAISDLKLLFMGATAVALQE